jgi:hypothetical protein
MGVCLLPSEGEGTRFSEGVKEVVCVATQKVRPDQDRDERQLVQRRQVSRTLTFGALAVAAIAGAIAVLIAIVAVDPEVQNTSIASTATAGESGTTEGSSDVAGEPNRFRPDGSAPAAPEHGSHGRVVMSETSGRYPAYAVYVFADGRVIWQRRTGAVNTTTGGWLVRRLTPKGIYLLQADTKADMGEQSNPKLLDPFGLPVDAWRDPTPEPYRASRYAVCPDRFYVPTHARLLPPRARDLLNESEEGYIDSCAVVTTADARRFDQILSSTDGVERDHLVDRGSLEYRIETESGIASIRVYPVLPNATSDSLCGDLFDC